jgi:hypothetical protein
MAQEQIGPELALSLDVDDAAVFESEDPAKRL